MNELPIIQKTYDLVKWYVPILTRLPRDYRFTLGQRMNNTLCSLLEGLLRSRFSRNKILLLENLNSDLDILQYQTRLLLDFELISSKRYEFVSGLFVDIGQDLGNWIKHLKSRPIKR